MVRVPPGWLIGSEYVPTKAEASPEAVAGVEDNVTSMAREEATTCLRSRTGL